MSDYDNLIYYFQQCINDIENIKRTLDSKADKYEVQYLYDELSNGRFEIVDMRGLDGNADV